MALRPRLHWVSPLPPAETDIAHYTRRILPALAARADVVLWTDAAETDPELTEFAAVRRIAPETGLPMALADLPPPSGGPEAAFIHIGNSWVFHSHFVQLAARVPSVIVLHDLALQELLHDMVYNRLMPRSAYEAGMARWYGSGGRAAARAVIDGRTRPAELIALLPGFELTLGRAAAVLTHGGAAFRAVAARRHVPAYRLNLPFAPGAEPTPERAAGGPLRLVQFGHTGPNRGLDQVLEVLGGLTGEVDFRFDICGKVWDTEHIDAKIRKLGLADRVTRHGFVAEPFLDGLLGEAHLVFNLRNPTMGEASGSQLRIWNAAAASVVSDHGWYGELPEGTVFKVSPREPHAPLADLIRTIATDRSLPGTIGAAGRARLLAAHTPDIYADGILAIAKAFPEDARTALLAERGRSALRAGPAQGAGLYRARLARAIEG